MKKRTRGESKRNPTPPNREKEPRQGGDFESRKKVKGGKDFSRNVFDRRGQKNGKQAAGNPANWKKSGTLLR